MLLLAFDFMATMRCGCTLKYLRAIWFGTGRDVETNTLIESVFKLVGACASPIPLRKQEQLELTFNNILRGHLDQGCLGLSALGLPPRLGHSLAMSWKYQHGRHDRGGGHDRYGGGGGQNWERRGPYQSSRASSAGRGPLADLTEQFDGVLGSVQASAVRPAAACSAAWHALRAIVAAVMAAHASK